MTAALPLFAERSPRVVFSTDGGGKDGLGLYRYELEYPTGIDDDRMALFCLANPSTATHLKPDPTVTRCIGYSRAWGYGWCGVANARAWRETNPKLVPADPEAIGPDNDAHILSMARRAAVVVFGWGELGGKRGADVFRLLHDAGIAPHALKLTKSGAPGHPLYLRADLKPFPLSAVSLGRSVLI